MVPLAKQQEQTMDRLLHTVFGFAVALGTGSLMVAVTLV